MTRGPETEASQELRPAAEMAQLLEDLVDGDDFRKYLEDVRYYSGRLTEVAAAVSRVTVLDAPTADALRALSEKVRAPMLEASQAVALLVQRQTTLAAGEKVAVSYPRGITDDGWGPLVSYEEATALERENLRLQIEQRQEQLASSFTRPEAAALLGVSPQTVSDMIAEHRLVGIKDARTWKLPAWQFTPDLEEPVLPQMSRLAREFPGGVVSLSRWMSRPNDNFAGRTPAQEMIRDSDRVFAVVSSLATV